MQFLLPSGKEYLRESQNLKNMRCPNCGEEYSPGMNFCPNCGHRLKAVTAIGQMIEDYRKRLTDKPEDPDTHYNLALAYLAAGDRKPAEGELRRVIELEPEFAEAWLRLAEVYILLGEKDKAKSHLAQALVLDPDLKGARKLLASLTD